MTQIILFFIIIFLLLSILVIRMAIKKEQNIYENGLEVWGEVSRCEHSLDHDLDSRYHSYIKYIGNDALEHEGLLNVRTNLPIGRKIKVKYIPQKYEEVVFVCQELS